MKTVALVVGMLGFAATTCAAMAAEAPRGACIRAAHGPERVALVAAPVDCCARRMQCTQYLSTATAVRPERSPRT